MKLVLLHQRGSDGDIFLRIASEFPPIRVTKWLSTLNENVSVQYGRARLKSGFFYLYAPTNPDPDGRTKDACNLAQGLQASGIVFPSEVTETHGQELRRTAQQFGAATIEISALAARRDQKPVRSIDTHVRDFRTPPRIEFAAILDDRKKLLGALWELYQLLQEHRR